MRELKNLCDIPSPAGDESRIFKYIADSFRNKFSIESDNLGNILINPNKNILISAHMDELALIISNITDDGFIHFLRNSGEDRKCLPGHRFIILAGDKVIPAVCMKKAIHVETDEEYNSVDKTENLVLSVGATSKDEVLGMGISIGDLVVYERNYTELGEFQICSQGLDDKAGSWVVIEILKELGNNLVTGALCCQEETGLIGARTLMSHSKFDISIDLDVCHSTEPALGINSNIYGDIKLGKGVVIEISSSCNRELSKKFIEIAKKNNIPYQVKAGIGGGTNTIEFLKGGAKTLLLSIPCQNMHTPVEIIDRRDLISAKNLILAWLIN